ncbi:MAG: TraR/DksA C4-type zinc finger protein [bacterium]
MGKSKKKKLSTGGKVKKPVKPAKKIAGKSPARTNSLKKETLPAARICAKKIPHKISPAKKKHLKKIIAGLEEELLFLQERIEKAKRNEWMGTVNDEIDNAVASAERDILFERVDRFIQRLDEIQNALKKVPLKTFGVCEKCGREISMKRLELIPYARFCYRCISE